jgi:transcriptional regulator with XRE-family HTH domain
MAADDPPIGTWIKRERERQRWTQLELAKRVKVDRKTIDNWENHRSRPRSSIGALEDAFGAAYPGTPAAKIPADLQRRLDALTDDERAYVVERLTAPPSAPSGREAG